MLFFPNNPLILQWCGGLEEGRAMLRASTPLAGHLDSGNLPGLQSSSHTAASQAPSTHPWFYPLHNQHGINQSNMIWKLMKCAPHPTHTPTHTTTATTHTPQVAVAVKEKKKMRSSSQWHHPQQQLVTGRRLTWLTGCNWPTFLPDMVLCHFLGTEAMFSLCVMVRRILIQIIIFMLTPVLTELMFHDQHFR